MKPQYPAPPNYGISWRSIQAEPVLLSGERIAVGTVVKGEDLLLMVARLIPAQKLKKIFGEELGRRIGDALQCCIDAAEKFYSLHPMSSPWTPPLEGFHLGREVTTLAKNMEDGLLQSAMHSSSFSVAFHAEQAKIASRSELTAPEDWRKQIIKAVQINRHDFDHCFQRKLQIHGSGVHFKFDFISEKYAAHFDAISENGNFQHALVRAQSKLWQLDRLRDGDALFKPALCELLLRVPADHDGPGELGEFVGELTYEASKRDIGLYTSSSSAEAAQHLIENAA